jgi:hypothetical protein
MDNNFAGLNGFIWWIGVVENTFDPLKMGRLRVRIIGWHNEDTNLMPSDSLPWADPLLPLTETNKTLDVKEGDWVMGFFTDGENAQKPVVFGQFNGIKTNEFNTNIGFSPQLTPEQTALLPKRDGKIVVDGAEEPSTPRLGRGIVEGTAVNIANNNRAHVCDISAAMKNAAAIARLKFSQLAKAIRDAVRAVLKALGFSPESESARFIEIAKKLLRELQFIQSVIQEIKDFTQVIVDYAKQIRAMIDWILSLPKKLAQLLAQCLQELLGAVTGAFSDLFSLSGASGSVGISDALKVVGEIAETGKTIVSTTIEVAQFPVQVVSALSTPASADDVQAAGNQLISFAATFTSSDNAMKFQMA